jgi:hypothetical protein
MDENCYCCIGSKCEWTDPKTCQELRGECKPPDDGPCTTKNLLGDYLKKVKDPVILLLTGGTFNSLDEFRDRFLAGTALGETLLRYNREFADHGRAIMRRDPSTFEEAVHVFLMAASFSRAILREMDKPGSEAERIWSIEAAKRADKIIERVMELTKEEHQQLALQHVREINRRCMELNPREIIDLIRSGDTLRNEPGKKGKLDPESLELFVARLYAYPEEKERVMNDLQSKGFCTAVSEYFALNDHQEREVQTFSERDLDVIVTDAVLAALRRNGKIELIQEGHTPPNMSVEVGASRERGGSVYVKFTC